MWEDNIQYSGFLKFKAVQKVKHTTENAWVIMLINNSLGQILCNLMKNHVIGALWVTWHFLSSTRALPREQQELSHCRTATQIFWHCKNFVRGWDSSQRPLIRHLWTCPTRRSKVLDNRNLLRSQKYAKLWPKLYSMHRFYIASHI